MKMAASCSRVMAWSGAGPSGLNRPSPVPIMMPHWEAKATAEAYQATVGTSAKPVGFQKGRPIHTRACSTVKFRKVEPKKKLAGTAKITVPANFFVGKSFNRFETCIFRPVLARHRPAAEFKGPGGGAFLPRPRCSA